MSVQSEIAAAPAAEDDAGGAADATDAAERLLSAASAITTSSAPAKHNQPQQQSTQFTLIFFRLGFGLLAVLWRIGECELLWNGARRRRWFGEEIDNEFERSFAMVFLHS